MGGGQTLSSTMSPGEIPWFDIQGETQPCDWLEKLHNLKTQTELMQNCTNYPANHGAVSFLVHRTTEIC